MKPTTFNYADYAQMQNDLEKKNAYVDALKKENKALRNELCQKCGRYREAHEGACNGCKWRRESEVSE